jgi:hypothetical protein
MISINCTQTLCIRYANRTIETIEILNDNILSRTFWIYNYEGKHFRVFDDENKLDLFLKSHHDHSIAEFESETAMENFLITQEMLK